MPVGLSVKSVNEKGHISLKTRHYNDGKEAKIKLISFPRFIFVIDKFVRSKSFITLLNVTHTGLIYKPHVAVWN